MFGRNKTEEESIKMVRLCNVATLVEAESILERLQQQSGKKSRGFSLFLPIFIQDPFSHEKPCKSERE